jgi:hypothetical protein
MVVTAETGPLGAANSDFTEPICLVIDSGSQPQTRKNPATRLRCGVWFYQNAEALGSVVALQRRT